MFPDEDDFKAAAARLFFDMINADGIIEDNEIKVLEGVPMVRDQKGRPVDTPEFTKEANALIRHGGLRKKYGIKINHLEQSARLTTTSAILVLKEWQQHMQARWMKCHPKSALKVENVMQDLRTISACDGKRDVSEAKLYTAVSMCLNDRLPAHLRAIPISYREGMLRFARREIVYLESELNKEAHKDIDDNLPYLKALLELHGYDFVFIPAVVKFLEQKAEDQLLKPILMFTKPFYYRDEQKAERFANELQHITTADFTDTFSRGATPATTLPSCFLIKVKTSTIEVETDDGETKNVKYSDFIAIPYDVSAADSLKRWLNNVLQHTDNITTLVSHSLEERLYCKGIHKTLIDYVVHRSNANIVRKVVVNLHGVPDEGDKTGKKLHKYVDFVGVDAGKVAMKPKEIALYLLFVVYSAYGKGVRKSETASSECKRTKETFYQLYRHAAPNANRDLYRSFSSIKTAIKNKINDVKSLSDKDRHNVNDGEDLITVPLNPDSVYIVDSADTSAETRLADWLKAKKITP